MQKSQTMWRNIQKMQGAIAKLRSIDKYRNTRLVHNTSKIVSGDLVAKVQESRDSGAKTIVCKTEQPGSGNHKSEEKTRRIWETVL